VNSEFYELCYQHHLSPIAKIKVQKANLSYPKIIDLTELPIVIVIAVDH